MIASGLSSLRRFAILTLERIATKPVVLQMLTGLSRQAFHRTTAQVQYQTKQRRAHPRNCQLGGGGEPVEMIAGDLPRRQRRLVEAWAELHAEELALAWQALQAGQLPQTIDPLQ
jgi:Domain of unknown function (DUF4160)